jgi:hypothetical protein
MRHKLLGALPRFELDGKWRCRGDRKDGEGNRDGEGNGDGEGNKDGEGEGDSEGDEGRRRYLKEDRDKEINSAPASLGDTDTHGLNLVFLFQIRFCGFFLFRCAITNGAGGIGAPLIRRTIR